MVGEDEQEGSKVVGSSPTMEGRLLKELKALEDAKAGVKGLVDSRFRNH